MVAKILIMIVIAYFLGACPWGLWIGLFFYHKDIRHYGSGNIGTTNVFRILGPKAGVAVLLLDILKGTLAASQPYLFHVPVNPLLIGMFASLGHTCSIFDHFHGGKAVATSAGILLAYSPRLFAIAALLYVGILCLTSMASCASIIAIVTMFIVALCEHDWIFATVAGILSLVVIFRHRSNIYRIVTGKESMVSFGLGHYLRERHAKSK